MRVAVVVSGSRGDVQPMLALAIGLRAAGHAPIVCTSPDNEAWARSLGCAFAALGEPLRDNPALRGGWVSRAFIRFARRQIRLQVRDLPRLVAGYDLIVASGLAWGVPAVAEHLGIAYRYVAFVPGSFLGTTRDPIGVRLVRGAADVFADLALGPAVNEGRARLGLAAARGVMAQMMGTSPILATDAELTVLPASAHLRATQTGYPLLSSRGDLSEQLRTFLAGGSPPLYAGFGSMPVARSEHLARLLVEAATRADQRLVVSRGWSNLPAIGSADQVLFVDDEPHDRLFPQVSAVIHHGGAGTVATAARAGVPQIVLPQAADQFLWRTQVVQLGLGPRAPMLRLATAASLAAAVRMAVDDAGYRRRAAAMAARLSVAPDGVATTVAELTRQGGTPPPEDATTFRRRGGSGAAGSGPRQPRFPDPGR